MNLVGYSDSEDSDYELAPTPALATKATTTSKPTAKPSFQKVVDRSNPHKIKVALPSASAPVDDIEADAPPAKKARTGGGGFGGFNALLPAPKKTGAAANGPKKGLGRGVSLRTGATPAFSREPVEQEENIVEQQQPQRDTAEDEKKADGLQKSASRSPAAKDEKEVKLVGKATIFKPMSVARNTKNKKKPQVVEAPKQAAATTAPAEAPKPAPKPRVSLFSIATEETSTAPVESTGQYKSFLEPSEETEDATEANGQFDQAVNNYDSYNTTTQSHHQPTTTSNTTSGHQSLTTIADDLNLSESAKRQLFGRHAGKNADLSAINVVNFNTDEEYAANEALRAKGEQVQHNPVRAIAPGKHSLQQLVNAVHTQKDALEEHFATGYRNRKEAGSKYGW